MSATHVGTEIARYVSGALPFPGEKRVHAHSNDALDKMRELAIGKIPSPFSDRLFFKTSAKVATERHWHVHSRTSIAPGTSLVQYRRDGFKSAAMLQNSFEVTGKYFLVRLESANW